MPRRSRPFLRLLQSASIAAPLEPEDLNAFLGIEPFDDDLDGRARRGQVAFFKLGDRQMIPSLLPPRSTKTHLPRTPITLPVRAPGPAFLAAIAVAGSAAPADWPDAGRRDLEARRIETGKSGLELGFQSGVPLPLERNVERLGSSDRLASSASSAASAASSMSERLLSGPGRRSRAGSIEGWIDVGIGHGSKSSMKSTVFASM